MHVPRVWQVTALLLLAAQAATKAAETIWVEGEKPEQSTMNRHPWYDQVKRDQLSGGDFASNFSEQQAGEAEYAFAASKAGEFEFWVRANPVRAKLSYQLNGGPWTEIDLAANQSGNTNIAADDKPDLRFIAWIKVGPVNLQAGPNRLRFRMDSALSHHGSLDCFVLSAAPFQPQGVLRPEQLAEHAKQLAAENRGWFAFEPGSDKFDAAGGFDLRSLNEKVAGEGGFIAVKGSQFIHSATGEPVRFWAVNGPPHELKDRVQLRQLARLLAKYGVNMVRIHGGLYDDNGTFQPEEVERRLTVVEAMKEEGIYSHLSIYFPLWLNPKPDNPWLKGYNGQQHPFAALYFNQDFQQQYQGWWKAMLLTPNKTTGKRLIDEPALAGVEIINEDSYFFWTFNTDAVPDPQLQIIETQFAAWLTREYGSLEAALARWQGLKTPRDNPAAGRIGFRPLWNMFNEKTPRDKDTARFLLESQRDFYAQTSKFLRGLGFQGVITCSNWYTASPQVFGPLEKYSYTVGDFIDRHGYFGCNHKGDNAAWSIRNGHTYSDRSALRFEAEEPGKPQQFVHPVMDPSYDGKPSMVSETTFTRPNRYRSEAPLFYSVYGALQDTDAVVHFALDSQAWTVKPGFFMQPWTLMSPAMLGQFPAAALIYRKGLIAAGEMLAELDLSVRDLTDLAGTPLPQDASFDELRLKDVPQGLEIKPGNVIDPLVHFAGRTNVRFSERGGPAKLVDLRPYVNRRESWVMSSTRQLKLDFGKGVLYVNAPAAQGVSGALRAAGPLSLRDVAIRSEMELGHIVAVGLDGQPLADSRRILLQVMSEEKNAGFRTQAAEGNLRRIESIGQDPWLVKEMQGQVRFKRSDAASLSVTALDLRGYPQEKTGTAADIQLRPQTMYYLIEP